MADYGWRSGDHRHWDQGRDRRDDDSRNARSSWRNDDRFMRGRSGYSWDREDQHGRPSDFGRESDYGSGYATPMDADRDLRNRPGGMSGGEGWGSDYNSRFGGGTFGRGYGGPAGYAGGYSSYGRSALGDDGLYERDRTGYGDNDRYDRPQASDYYGQHSGEAREGDRNWLDRAGDEMASWVGDRDAARRRDMDRMHGHAGRGPKGYTRSDDRIREDVNDRLTDDWMLDATDIDANVSNGEVTLSGTVDSRDDKHRAEHLVEGLSGVRHVQNNLRVKERWREDGAANQHLSTPVGSSESHTSLTGAQTSTGTSTGSGIGGNAGQRAGNGGIAH